jgi:hypothetical protein
VDERKTQVWIRVNQHRPAEWADTAAGFAPCTVKREGGMRCQTSSENEPHRLSSCRGVFEMGSVHGTRRSGQQTDWSFSSNPDVVR